MIDIESNPNYPDPFADLITGFPEPSPISRSNLPKPELYFPSRLPWYWLTKADSLGGSALAVGLMIHRRRAICSVAGSKTKLGLTSCKAIGLGKFAVRKKPGSSDRGRLGNWT